MQHPFRVRDIHADGVAEAFDRLTREDMERIFKARDSFVESPCPACRSEQVDYAFTHQTLDYKRCQRCETLFISPAPTEEQHLDYVIHSEAMAYCRTQMTSAMKESRLPMYRERLSFALDAFRRLGIEPASVLELGAGNGEFALELAAVPFIENITLLEPQTLDLDKPNIHIIHDGFEALKKQTLTFDTIFAWEVIEHILEPDNFLQTIRAALKPNAAFILSTPNEKSTETRTLQTESSNILFDHVRLYNPESIRLLLRRNGFKVVELTTPGKLDAEKLSNYFRKYPERLNNPSLAFLLEADDAKLAQYQKLLVEQKLSSHMRVIAMRDEAWQPEHKKLVSAQTEPRTFNQTVLMHSKNSDNPYHGQLLQYILHGLMAAPTTGKLLDLGGGWGTQAYAAQRIGYDVISLDREPASANVPYVLCDIANDPFPINDHSIDIVFSKSVIEHFYMHQLPHVFSEIMRVLKPGGHVVFLTPDWHSNMREFYQIFTHVTPYTASSIQQCIQMYGFENVHAKVIMQLPETWHSSPARLFANFLQLLPLPRRCNKWVRWSKERLLIGYGMKP
ncbi:MAG: methyltransferase domain-containing protein [Alphaproteobacteria bacterium]